MNLVEKLQIVQSKLKAPKSQRNNFGNYNYRSCEDILEALKPVLKEVGAVVTITDDILLIGERYYIKALATFTNTEDGQSISVSALAREEESKKGMDSSQLTGSTSSYARKYALNGLFAIDDTKDSDYTNTGSQDKPSEAKQVKQLSDAQVKRLFALGGAAGFDNKKVTEQIQKKFRITDAHSLTKEQYDQVCKAYEEMKK